MMYHYTECGLDNVWLANGYNEIDTAYGKAFSVTAADELLREIAVQVAHKPGRLTGKEFRFLRVHLRLSQAAMAKVQGVSEQNVSLWERHGKVPRANDTLLRFYFFAHAAGDETVRSAFDRIMTVERLVRQKIVATSGRNGWKFKVEETKADSGEQAVEV